MNTSAQVMEETIKYFDGDLKRINHLIKVYGFAKTIGELEFFFGKLSKIFHKPPHLMPLLYQKCRIYATLLKVIAMVLLVKMPIDRMQQKEK